MNRFEFIDDNLALGLFLSLFALPLATAAYTCPNCDEVNDHASCQTNDNKRACIAFILFFLVVLRDFSIIDFITCATTHRPNRTSVVLGDKAKLVYSVYSLGAVKPNPAALRFEISID